MAVNKRTAKTVFSIKDVIVVGGALLTAIGPLIANDMRIASVQTELAARKEDIKIMREENLKLRSDVDTAIQTALTNKATLSITSSQGTDIRQLQTDVAVLKERTSILETKRRP